jgi:suppressor of tumorigenicity protein 13
MGLKIDTERVKQLKQFVVLCKENPAILNSPDLAFFKEWLVR